MIEIRKCADTTTTWAELRDAVHAGSSPLNIGDEIDIELKTGERVTLVCELVKERYSPPYCPVCDAGNCGLLERQKGTKL